MSKKINILKNKLPRKIWYEKKSILKNYLIEERGRIKGQASLLVKPENTKQVSIILKICNKENIKVVPQGGRTSLSGGTVPIQGDNEIILSLEKMNKVVKINKNRVFLIFKTNLLTF